MMKGDGKPWARACGTCRSAACLGCGDAERVRMCEACERVPAAFICKADNASLCAACDADVHAANPLASRHHRVPVSACFHADVDDETASWLLLPQAPAKPGFLLGDEYWDFMDYNSVGDTEEAQPGYGVPQKMPVFGDDMAGRGVGGDSVVPCREQLAPKGHMMEQQHGFQLNLDFDYSSKAAYNSYSGSMTHSASVSSFDVSVVPDAATVSDFSTSNIRPPKGTIDVFSGSLAQPPVQLSPIDREARVLRYREKKKMRKFEKTIRYASRKAYAETRPRIKGRFAKRTDADTDPDAEVDQMFSAALMADTGYGVVPSF